MYIHDLNKRKKELNSALKRVKQGLRKMPPGRLRIKAGPPSRYYQVLDSANRCGKYLGKDDFPKAQALAQKAYLERLQDAITNELSFIGRIEKVRYLSPEDVYSSLSELRKQLVDPFFLSDEEYAKAWLREPYEGKEFNDTDPFYKTVRGERVRSKSEILIANALNDLGIPYRYEAPLFLENDIVIYPDFTILKPHARTVCYFEHCGRMDDPGYLNGFIKRENLYIQNGLIPGIDVFMSFESSTLPINMDSVRQMLAALFVGA